MTTFLLIATAHFLALLSPGPDFFLILKIATTQKRFLSYLLCFGIAMGHFLYLVLVFFGLNMFNDFEVIFVMIQILGIAYLVYLAHQLFQLSKKPSSAQKISNLSAQKIIPLSTTTIFFQGFAISILNPKNAVFYASLIALLGSKISFSTQIFYITWMTSIVFFWDCFIAAIFSRQIVLNFFNQWINIIYKITAAVFLLFAISLSIKLFFIR